LPLAMLLKSVAAENANGQPRFQIPKAPVRFPFRVSKDVERPDFGLSSGIARFVSTYFFDFRDHGAGER
jgi:hypothetical protein